MSSSERCRVQKVAGSGLLYWPGQSLLLAKTVQRKIKQECRPADEKQSRPDKLFGFVELNPGENVFYDDKHQANINEKTE